MSISDWLMLNDSGNSALTVSSWLLKEFGSVLLNLISNALPVTGAAELPENYEATVYQIQLK